MNQLKTFHCELCGEQLSNEYATVAYAQDDKEKRFYFCSPECMFATFLVMFIMNSEASRNMSKLLRKLKSAKKKEPNG